MIRAARECATCGEEIAFGAGGLCEDCRAEFDGFGDLEAQLAEALRRADEEEKRETK